MQDLKYTGGEHAVLLLHGLGGNPLEMRYVAKALHRAGYTAAVPHIEGYGCGSEPTRWEDWLATARSQYDALAATHLTVSVCGLCIGATLGAALAADVPEMPALSMLSTTLRYDGWAIPWYRWLLEPAYLVGLGRRYRYVEREPFGLKNEQLREWIARSMREQGESHAGAASLGIEHLYQALRLARHVRRRLPAVTADTLVVHAIDDETASPRNAEYVYERLRCRHKRKILLDDCYHIITMDNEREIVARETCLAVDLSLERRGFRPHAARTARPLARMSRRSLRRIIRG